MRWRFANTVANVKLSELDHSTSVDVMMDGEHRGAREAQQADVGRIADQHESEGNGTSSRAPRDGKAGWFRQGL
jgi:hypothetical protein